MLTYTLTSRSCREINKENKNNKIIFITEIKKNIDLLPSAPRSCREIGATFRNFKE